MAVNLSPVGGVAAQFFDNNGVPLAGGKLYTYAAGTTTPATAYTSSQGVTAWSNPIILNSAGRVSGSGEIWITDGILYKFVLETSTGVLIATYDNISGINSSFVAFTNQQEIVTATAGQTVFNLGISYQLGTNSLSVFVDGVNQYGPGAQYAYTETDSDTVTFTSGLHVGAEVKFTTSQQQGAGAVDASQVSYDPPFIDSVATNVEAKLSECLSVYDFGAVGDGVTSDTAAFNLAIAAALAAGVALYVPPGNYYLATALTPFTLPAAAALRGTGRTLGIYGHIESSVITYAAAADLFDVSIQDNFTPFTIQGLRIQRALSTFASIPAGSAIKFSGLYGFRVQDVVVTYFDTAVELAGSLAGTIDGLWAGWCLQGIRAYTAAGISANQVAVHNTKIVNTRDYAIWVTNVSTWTLDSVTVEGCGDIPNAIKAVPYYFEECGEATGLAMAFTGVNYVEANYADYSLYISHTYECQYNLHNISFNRVSTADTVINDIFFNANSLTAGNSPAMIDVRGSRFNSILGNVRSALRPRIAVTAAAGWDQLTAYTDGATGLNGVDAPVWAATVRVNSPARAQVAKARFAGATTTLGTAYNISAFTKNGVGDYNFTFRRPVDYANYSLNFTAINSNCVMKVINEVNTGNNLTDINVVTHVNGVATDTDGILEVTGDTL